MINVWFYIFTITWAIKRVKEIYHKKKKIMVIIILQNKIFKTIFKLEVFNNIIIININWY